MKLSVLSLFLCAVAGFGGQHQAPRVFAEGAIVAVQKQSRHPERLEGKGIGVYVEGWVVRVGRWEGEVKTQPKYIRVDYLLYQRGLADEEINQPRLRFQLREPRPDEARACEGRVLTSWRKPYTTRPVQEADYERTQVGLSEVLPPLKSLPCFIVEKPPTVVVGR